MSKQFRVSWFDGYSSEWGRTASSLDAATELLTAGAPALAVRGVVKLGDQVLARREFTPSEIAP